MTKLIIAVSVAAIFGLNTMVKPDCHADNGKRFDNCQIVDGKEVFTK